MLATGVPVLDRSGPKNTYPNRKPVDNVHRLSIIPWIHHTLSGGEDHALSAGRPSTSRRRGQPMPDAEILRGGAPVADGEILRTRSADSRAVTARACLTPRVGSRPRSPGAGRGGAQQWLAEPRRLVTHRGNLTRPSRSGSRARATACSAVPRYPDPSCSGQLSRQQSAGVLDSALRPALGNSLSGVFSAATGRPPG